MCKTPDVDKFFTFSTHLNLRNLTVILKSEKAEVKSEILSTLFPAPCSLYLET